MGGHAPGDQQAMNFPVDLMLSLEQTSNVCFPAPKIDGNLRCILYDYSKHFRFAKDWQGDDKKRTLRLLQELQEVTLGASLIPSAGSLRSEAVQPSNQDMESRGNNRLGTLEALDHRSIRLADAGS